MRPAILILSIFPVALSYTFPEKFGRCHVKDANLDDCVKTNIEKALRLIGQKGIASINLPPVDPLEVSRLEMGAGRVPFVQKYEDIKIYGFGDSTVEDAHLDLAKKTLTFTMYLPTLSQKAKYDVDGKILELVISGSGNSVITFSGMRIKHKLHFKEETRNGMKYFEIKSYSVEMSTEKVHYEFDNLFAGDKQMRDMVLKGLNELAVPVFNEIKQGVEVAYAKVYKSVADKLFQNIPVDEIFLP